MRREAEILVGDSQSDHIYCGRVLNTESLVVSMRYRQLSAERGSQVAGAISVPIQVGLSPERAFYRITTVNWQDGGAGTALVGSHVCPL